MSTFKQYKRKETAELRPVTQREMKLGVRQLIESKISISAEDMKAGSPKLGDQVARNTKNHEDQWLIAYQYFIDNFEPAEA